MRLIVIAVALLTGFVPCFAHAGTVGSVSGYVFDYNGKPISGATVRFESPAQVAETKTNAHGYYAVVELTPGQYKAEISQEHYISFDAIVEIAADQSAVFSVSMHPKVFVVIDGPGARPWPGLIRAGTISDVYTIHSADRAPADLLRYIPGITVPIIAPQRGVP